MEPLYFTEVTQYGAGQLAAAAANKTTINITQMAVGDGSGSAVAPDDQQKQLVNERYRGELNFLGSYDNDPTLIIAELIIPEDVGGWTMREAGLYDSKGKLFAVANTPPNAKPLPDTGITKTQVVRIVIKLQNSENIQMITDTSLVTATRDYVDAASEKGLAAWDWGDHKLEGYLKTYVDTKYSAGTGLNLTGTQFSIKYGNAAGTAAQGNDSRLSDARDWSASVVSQAEAEAGTHTTARKWTAQRVAQSAVAAFNRMTSPFTRTLLSRANAALARNDLELGSAATKNAGTGVGNVMPVGSFSLGSTNANSYTASGTTELFTYNPSYLPTTAPSNYGTGIKIGHSYAGTAAEILIPHNEPAILARGRQDRPFIEAVLTTKEQSIGGKKNFSEDISVSLINIGTGGGGLASNVSVGVNALAVNTTGYQNAAVGTHALRANKTGVSCTSVGAYSLKDSLGSRNTAIGDAAGTGIVNSSKSTALGASTLVTGDYSGATAIGVDANVTGNNQIQLGASNTTTFAYGAVQARSDKRDKTEIRDTSLGLDFVLRLRPVDYKWDMRDFYRPEAPSIDEYETEEEFNVANKQWLDAVKLNNITPDGSKKRHRYHHGFIAQEVQGLISETEIDFGGFQDHSKNNGEDVLSLGYEEFIAPMVKAIQELKAELDRLKIDSIHPDL